MQESPTILLELCKEQWAQARHSELQRATVSGLLIAVQSAIVGALARDGFPAMQTIPLALLVVILSIFGRRVTLKLNELFHFHHEKAKTWQAKIDELCPSLEINKREREAEQKHENEFPKWRAARWHKMWIMMHDIMAIVGLILIVFSSIQWITTAK